MWWFLIRTLSFVLQSGGLHAHSGILIVYGSRYAVICQFFFFLLHKQLTQMFSGMLRECVEFVSRREEVSWFCRLFHLWLLITFRLRVQRKLWENTLSKLLTWVTQEHKPDKKEGWPEFTSNELILVGIYLKSGAHNQIVISAIVWATKAFLNIAKY